MTIPKPLLFIICAAVILASISHWRSQKGVAKSSFNNSIQNIPEKQQIADFAAAINSGDPRTLKESLGRLGVGNGDIFAEAVKQGSIANVWGIQKDGDITRIALEVLIQYHENLSVHKTGRALFVFQLRDSKWQIEWYFPGAMLLSPKNQP